MLIVFEGPDGAGKSTLIHQLFASLAEERALHKPRTPLAAIRHVCMVREPYDSVIGTYLRVALQEKALSQKAMELAFTAARREVYDDLAYDEAYREPHSPDNLILSDRSFISTVVYQGVVGQDLSPAQALDAYLPLHDMVGLPYPDAVLLLVSQAPLGTEQTTGMNLMTDSRRRYLDAYRGVTQELARRGLVRHCVTTLTDLPGARMVPWAMNQLERVLDQNTNTSR